MFRPPCPPFLVTENPSSWKKKKHFLTALLLLLQPDENKQKKKKAVPGPHATSTPLPTDFRCRDLSKNRICCGERGRRGRGAQNERGAADSQDTRTETVSRVFHGSGERHTAIVSGVKVYEEGGGGWWSVQNTHLLNSDFLSGRERVDVYRSRAQRRTHKRAGMIYMLHISVLLTPEISFLLLVLASVLFLHSLSL